MTTRKLSPLERAAMRWYRIWYLPELREWAAGGVKEERTLAEACARLVAAWERGKRG